jgi:hypothetical protein
MGSCATGVACLTDRQLRDTVLLLYAITNSCRDVLGYIGDTMRHGVPNITFAAMPRHALTYV